MSGGPDNEQFVSLLTAACDPVFEAAPIEFSRQVLDPATVLYQTEPVAFARAYPSSEIEETYGSGWPPLDINFWVELLSEEQRIRVVAEGWQEPERSYTLDQGVGPAAALIAAYFANLLIQEGSAPPRDAAGAPHADLDHPS